MPSYASEVLSDTPLFYFRLGESSGTTMVDSSGNGNNGTYGGAPTLGSTGLLVGDSDTAVTWNGTSQSASRASTAASTFTAEVLIKPSNVTGTHVLLSRQDVAAGTGAWTLRLEGTTLKFYYWNGGGTLQTAVSASTVFAVATIYHVAVVFTASSNVFLYVNGTQVGTAATTTMLAVSASFRVAASGSGEYFAGVLDEAAYYTSALSPTRIAAHYTASITAPGSGSVSVSVPTAYAPAVGFAPTWSELITATGDTSNDQSGRRRNAIGAVTITRPVTAVPAGLTLGQKVDKTIAYPTPTMVDGRPT